MKTLLLSVLITSSTILNATITVTNVGITNITDPTSSYQFDLDNDATPDFSIDAYQVGNAPQIQLKMLHPNAETVPLLAATVYVVAPKNYGDSFGSWWQSYDSFIYHVPEFTAMDNAGIKYIGLRLFKNGNYYYGWVQVRVFIYPNIGMIEIVNYAFEDIPNTKITAGQTVSSTTSIEELNNSEFTIYPNPVKDIVTISIASKVVINTINLYSVTGKLIKEIQLPKNQIDLSELKSGIYFIEIISDKQKVVKKLLKN